jgi:hypothetical protein
MLKIPLWKYNIDIIQIGWRVEENNIFGTIVSKDTDIYRQGPDSVTILWDDGITSGYWLSTHPILRVNIFVVLC